MADFVVKTSGGVFVEEVLEEREEDFFLVVPALFLLRVDVFFLGASSAPVIVSAAILSPSSKPSSHP
jgi:hypothetical protein